jgi:UDP-glucose 4-epimerase
MVRDYIYVKDVVDMIIATLETTPQHHVYNLGSGKGYSVNELLEVIEKVTGKSPRRHIKPVPSTFVRRSILNVDRFMEEFGVQPAMSIEEGVQATYEYLKESLDKKAEYGN